MPRVEPQSKYRYDEISPAELWNILVHRRLWILAAIAGCLLVGAAYVLLKSPVYVASVTMRIGQVGGSGPFESVDTLSARLLAEHGQDIAEGVKRERPFLARAGAARAAPSAIQLVTEGDSPHEAADLLLRIATSVSDQHNKIYEAQYVVLAERLREIDRQRSQLQREFEAATVLANKLGGSNPVQASLLLLERSRIIDLIGTLEGEKPELAQKTSPPITQAICALGPITAPARAASPKKAVVFTVAAVVGLLLGISAALTGAFLTRARALATVSR